MAKGSTLGFMKVSKNYTRAMINSITKSASKERNELLKSNIIIEIDMSSRLTTKIKLSVKSNPNMCGFRRVRIWESFQTKYNESS